MMNKKLFANNTKYAIFLAILLFIVSSCDFQDVGNKQQKPPQKPNPPTDTAGTVPIDGTLEAVTWNLELYSGQQTKVENDAQVLDSLKADLYAFEELQGSPKTGLTSKEAIQKLADRIKGYKVILDNTSNQDNAFLYNTKSITPISSGKIDASDGQTSTEWAERFPFYFSFNYKPGDGTEPVSVYAVVIHAKANYGSSSEKQDAYQRRKNAAEDLYQYLTNKKPNARIILLGDFNDDTDVSIYDESSPSPYKKFVDDSMHYDIITKPITKAMQSSYISGNYSDLIDHIFISNEMVPYYIKGSAKIYFKAQDFIDDYVNTTSDHLPVWAKFDMRR